MTEAATEGNVSVRKGISDGRPGLLKPGLIHPVGSLFALQVINDKTGGGPGTRPRVLVNRHLAKPGKADVILKSLQPFHETADYLLDKGSNVLIRLEVLFADIVRKEA